MCPAPSAPGSQEKKLPAVFIPQTPTAKTPMTARQFWKENFPNKKATIFEVMEAYRQHGEEELKNKLDDKLQRAEAARLEAQTNVKTLLQQNDRLKKEFEEYKEDERERLAGPGEY